MAGSEFPQIVTDFDSTSNSVVATMGEYLGRAPGFFTPYRSLGDFALTISAPVTAPFCFAVLTGLIGVAAPLAAAVSVTSFLAAGISAAAGNNEARLSALTVGVVSAFIAIAAPLVAALSALATVLSFISAVAAIGTRTGATVVNAIANGVSALVPCGEQGERDLEMTTNYSSPQV